MELVTLGKPCPCPGKVGAGSKQWWGRVGVVAKCPAWLPCGISGPIGTLAPGLVAVAQGSAARRLWCS